jgi:large subunit ribosomal protein L25
VSEVKLVAEPRSEFGKGAARRLRRAHKVPAVLYGHGKAPVHVALDGHATMMALKQTNALLSIELNGGTQLALPKDVQRHPVRGVIEHVDLLLVVRGEKVTVDVPLRVVGEAASGTMIVTGLTSLSVLVEATAIPGSIDVDVAGLSAGTMVTAGEVVLPAGATLAEDAGALVVNVTAEEGEEPEAEDGDQAAEGESAG